jgi:hypothetical protein
MQNPDASRRGVVKRMSNACLKCIAVIARSGATKQSSFFLSLRGKLDCFAEPVIGRAFARPVGSQ